MNSGEITNSVGESAHWACVGSVCASETQMIPQAAGVQGVEFDRGSKRGGRKP